VRNADADAVEQALELIQQALELTAALLRTAAPTRTRLDSSNGGAQ
jgi:hypothetical protein